MYLVPVHLDEFGPGVEKIPIFSFNHYIAAFIVAKFGDREPFLVLVVHGVTAVIIIVGAFFASREGLPPLRRAGAASGRQHTQHAPWRVHLGQGFRWWQRTARQKGASRRPASSFSMGVCCQKDSRSVASEYGS